MIPNANQITVVDTTEGEKIDMQLDANSLAHVISVLTDLYSDKILACIREYSTNAYDSHVEAGIKRPIEVVTPTGLSPLFVVRDFGIGMNAKDIRETYSKYGASTKRATNDLSGVLGLGSKAALTYGDQFTVKGVKDGIRTLVSVSRNAEAAGTMTILEEEETTEPNGVEIQIAVKPGDDFSRRAEKFFEYWTPGTVLLNGQPPKFVWNDPSLIELDKDTFVANSADYNPKSIAVMGNVSYPIDLSMREIIANGAYVIKRVPIGELDFVPSREALQMTPRTKKAVDDLHKQVQSVLANSLQRELDAVPTAHEAMQKWISIGARFHWRFLNAQQLTYKGKTLPTENIRLPEKYPIWQAEVHKLATEARGNQFNRNNFNNTQTLYVKNFSLKSFHKKHVLKIRTYIEQKTAKGITYDKYVYVVGDDMPLIAEWLDPKQIVDWEVIKDLKADKEELKKATSPQYKVYTPGSGWWTEMSADELDKYAKGNNGQIIYGESYTGFEYIKEIMPKAFVVSMAERRFDKFKRLIPYAKTIPEATKEWAEKYTTKYPVAIQEKYLLAEYVKDKFDRYDETTRTILGLDTNKVNDPIIGEIAKWSKITIPADYTEARKIKKTLAIRGIELPAIIELDTKKTKGLDTQLEKIKKSYPLLAKTGHSATKDDLINYINAMHYYKEQGKI